MGLPVALIGHNHICPMVDPGPVPKPHVGGAIVQPMQTVAVVGGVPVATLGSQCACMSPAPDAIVSGSTLLIIDGKPAARMGDSTAHGGKVAQGLGWFFCD
ncbi:PAAR domain-containing protein [Limoniibacter endophyticus]|uniref:Zn-binding protein involved in type VI secretion n=1 Tax=Limoniibacter endophyticus TaxID=1565040 RepID=A0A8J3DH07_9HYPH|nr:PAAR domain-containing protein [Limoniibacter endophyticus]GHC69467.1 hypothetical protein GCM10010136_15340 [Limoniibacter endophyticus]